MEGTYDKSLEELFENPPNEFRMMPFWFWNHEMIEKEVTRQIQDHMEHGIGGEFIHPRHGRLTPYMGRRWLEVVEAAADKCKELDMPCFLYDEDNWPSGPAGGYITGPYNKDNRGKFLVLFDENTFTGPARVEYELDYEKLSPENEFYAAIAVPNPETYPDFSAVIDQQEDVSTCVTENVFSWDVPDGEWCVLFFAMGVCAPDSNLNGYIDILRKDTVKQFIDFTHKKYANYFIERGKRDYLGTVVPGIFTDEPTMANANSSATAILPVITFTPEMPKHFEEMFGYDFNSILVSMIHDTGAISAKHRCAYWNCAIDMYVNAFYKQIYDYCNIINWRATGHVNSEGNFPSHIRNHGDFFRVFQYMHYGGVDQLTEEVRPDHIEDMWNLPKDPYTGMAREMLLASKFASSAAHLLGKPRVLVEAFGTSSWDITMASAKRVTDYLTATGCDLFVPHSFNISEDGYRKGDHPAAFNYQPYYVEWKRLADHQARLAAILNAHSGILNADVLYFYPTKSFHAEMAPSSSEMAVLMGEYMTHNADCIFRQQLDFELANEDLIIGGSITGDQLRIKDQNFKMLLLGVTTCVSLDFANRLKEYFEAGGKILATYCIPYKEEMTGESDEVAGIMEGIFGLDPKALAKEIAARQIKEFELVENTNEAGGHAVLIKGPKLLPYLGGYYPLFEEACRKLLPLESRGAVAWKDAEAKSHAAYIMVTHKTIGTREFYFIINSGRDASYSNVRVKLGTKASTIELWDTLTGEVVPSVSFWIEEGKSVMTLDFPPNQSYLFAITPDINAEPTNAPAIEPAREQAESIDLGTTWSVKANAPNGAMLYQDWHSSYKVEAGRAGDYVQKRTFTHDFNVEDLDAITPVRVVIEGIVGDYGWCKTTTDMPIGGDRAHFKLPGNISLEVNGQRVHVSFDFEPVYLDAYWIVADISKFLIEGKNTIKMTCNTNGHGTFHVVTDPWRLIGNFDSDDEPVPTIRKPRDKIDLGDMTGQGFPHFHGGLSYSQTVVLPDDIEGKKIELDVAGTTDLIEVHVNCEHAGLLWWKWSKDISALVKPGENLIELVYFGVAQNILQTNIKPQGIVGPVKINIY
jgi:hypothetical protein